MPRRLPAEWEPCDGVMMAWPHAETDWAPVLDAAQACAAAIAAAISPVARVLMLSPQPEDTRVALLAVGADPAALIIAAGEVGDTWCRDYGPLTVYEDGRPILLDCGFNGWGLKFPAALDNTATRRLAAAGYFAPIPLRSLGLILEGGSIESDGAGTILSTAACLLEANRNPSLSPAQIEHAVLDLFGASRLQLLQHGHLAGDDTDAHIDTLARLCPADSICYQSCSDADDEHFQSFAAMAEELAQLRTADDAPYRLLPLPWPGAFYAADGHRLPATYANFLVINGRVLVPSYGVASDAEACAVLAQAFPEHQIIAIDCRVLIEQHGSLHCMTMQLPLGTLPAPTVATEESA
ncbi:MAG: agmatine deiminase family protein [Planctomycetota bacterium]|nr:MAG: agmatine deiminase family protein [Planctomycetota bacterium]